MSDLPSAEPSKRDVAYKALREMIVQGVMGIARGQSPTEVRETIQAFVSAKNRAEVKPNV